MSDIYHALIHADGPGDRCGNTVYDDLSTGGIRSGESIGVAQWYGSYETVLLCGEFSAVADGIACGYFFQLDDIGLDRHHRP